MTARKITGEDQLYITQHRFAVWRMSQSYGVYNPSGIFVCGVRRNKYSENTAKPENNRRLELAKAIAELMDKENFI